VRTGAADLIEDVNYSEHLPGLRSGLLETDGPYCFQDIFRLDSSDEDYGVPQSSYRLDSTPVTEGATNGTSFSPAVLAHHDQSRIGALVVKKYFCETCYHVFNRQCDLEYVS
jgi:hypothetical protein